ncbi:MAG: DUF898 domain-containing protein [Bacteroidales bacterium]|nr:DUF898 domain-containing protein [Bacteroidales bacterium]
MDSTSTNSKTYSLSYNGTGGDYFGVIIVNWLLTVLTLGIFYPWAKANQLKYIYGSSSLNSDAFAFHGTGKEMFKGFLKTILIFGALMIIFGALSRVNPVAAVVVLYLGIFAIMPLAIHGSYRYRMSRTSWRGIRFAYKGNRNELSMNFYKWVFLTVITFGIYGSWMVVNLREYLISNIKFGNIEFNYKADGGTLLIINIKGYFLTILTLGIYAAWWQKDLFEFYVNNTKLTKDDKTLSLKSTVTGGGFFKLFLVNLLIVVFTLGLGYAWVVTRTMKYIFTNIEIDGDIDLDSISQSDENFTNATGDEMADFLDIDFII